MSGGGRGRPQPYYPNQGYQQWNNDYNFSSDVNLSNSNGSFQFGSPPPPVQNFRPHYRGGGGGGGGFRGGGFRGRGGGYPGGGFRGGYSPRPYGGYEQRPFRPQFYRGRFPRQGPPGGGTGNRGGRGFGRGHYQAHKQRRPDGDDPFYHSSMFEDPWRFLMPKRITDNQSKESTKSEARDDKSRGSNVAEAMEVGDVREDDDKSDERTGIPVVSSMEEQEMVGGAIAGDDSMKDGEGPAVESVTGVVGGEEEVKGSVGEEEVKGSVGEEEVKGSMGKEEVKESKGEEQVKGSMGEEQVVNEDDSETGE